jgi:hypothetical protein
MPALNTRGNTSAGRDKLWRAMRMLRHFRIGELLEICAVSRKTAAKYIECLARAEYLRVAKPGRHAGNVYTLIKNTGPFAPRAGRAGVSLDPNLEIVRLRDRYHQLTAETAKVKSQMERLGAFVERSQTTGAKSA